MRKKPIIIGNWKMYKTNKEASAYVKELASQIQEVKAEVGLSVPFTAISLCAELSEGSDLLIGAQNMNSALEGAFTGEIAGKMLKDAGASFVILGHSERRTVFGESDEEIAKKIARAVEEELRVILCIGETLEQREKGFQEPLEKQLRSSCEGIKKKSAKYITLAYEPVWAIGTGKSATPSQVEETHIFLRSLLEDIFGKVGGKKIPILYGGSVKAANVQSFLREKHVNGALVGGASLKAQSFRELISAATS